MTKRKGIYIRVTDEEKKDIEGAAKRDRRSISGYMLALHFERKKKKGPA